MSNDAPNPSLPAPPDSPDPRDVSASSSHTLSQLSDDTAAADRAPEEGKHPKGKRKRTACVAPHASPIEPQLTLGEQGQG